MAATGVEGLIPGRDKGGSTGRKIVPQRRLGTVEEGQQQRHVDVSGDLKNSFSSLHTGPEEQRKWQENERNAKE